MPKLWVPTDDRPIESFRPRDDRHHRPDEPADDLAARRVIERKRTSERSAHAHMSGSQATSTPLETRTRDELYDRAKELGIDGRSAMAKHELIEAIRERS